jgi:glycosyltransferase involved in cell wall biosynthesis
LSLNLPTLSVITPSYNGAEFIEDAILSVSHQREVSVEHVVVDGASTDGTANVLRRHPYVRFTSEPDCGQSDAINKGFLQAGGGLVGWLNADE